MILGKDLLKTTDSNGEASLDRPDSYRKEILL